MREPVSLLSPKAVYRPRLRPRKAFGVVSIPCVGMVGICAFRLIHLRVELTRRGSRISAMGGRQGIDDLIWDGDERFLTYANTDLQLFKMFLMGDDG